MSARPGPLRAARRFVLTLVGVVFGAFCYCVCQSVFAGYPQYGTRVLSYLGLALITFIAGLAWITDERRIDDED
jgi:hypothetical protein